MVKLPVSNFTLLESVYGKFIVNRHCSYQAEHLIKTGLPHIEAEIKTILSIVNLLPTGCVVIDAGANAGLVTVPIAQLIKDRGGAVHAFEVQRMMFYALCGSVALNDLGNVFVSQKGLGTSRASMTMDVLDFSVPQDFGMFSLVPDSKAIRSSDGRLRETVEIVPVDDLNLPRADFFKIDVEGMEIEVLAGAKQTIRKSHPWCWIEYREVKVEQIKAQFSGLPYRFYIMDELNMLCVPTDRPEAGRLTIKAPEA